MCTCPQQRGLALSPLQEGPTANRYFGMQRNITDLITKRVKMQMASYRQWLGFLARDLRILMCVCAYICIY